MVENEAILYTKMYFYEKEIKQKLFENLILIIKWRN